MGTHTTHADWADIEVWAEHWAAMNERFTASLGRTRQLLQRMDAEAGSPDWQGELRAESAGWRQLQSDFEAMPWPGLTEGVRVPLRRFLAVVGHAADEFDAWLNGRGGDHLDAGFATLGEAVRLQQDTMQSARRAIGQGRRGVAMRRRLAAPP